MKRLVAMGFLMFLSNLCVGQNQIKLYLKQIAANKVYIEYLQKGYKIAKNGLTTIGNIKNGHFSLDKDFFAGLQNINPKVRGYAKVADIIALNIQIVRQYKKTMNEARATDRFNRSELDYMGKVFNRLIDNCTVLVDELMVLLTPSELKMSDDERIKRIELLCGSIQDNYVFVKDFSGGMSVMALQRSRELTDAARLRWFYE